MQELLNILQQEVELHEQLISQLQKESEGFGRLRSSELLKLQVKNLVVYAQLPDLKRSGFSSWKSLQIPGTLNQRN